MKKRIAMCVAAVALLLIAAVVAFGSVYQAGRTASGQGTFKFAGQANGQVHVSGVSSSPQTLSGRLLRNGVQIGGIANWSLAPGANYNSTVTFGRNCVNQGQYATWVAQARLQNFNGTTGWTSGPGANLLC